MVQMGRWDQLDRASQLDQMVLGILMVRELLWHQSYHCYQGFQQDLMVQVIPVIQRDQLLQGFLLVHEILLLQCVQWGPRVQKGQRVR